MESVKIISNNHSEFGEGTLKEHLKITQNRFFCIILSLE